MIKDYPVKNSYNGSMPSALQSMMLWVNKQPICDFWKSGLKKNCSVTKVEVKDGQIKVLEEGEKQYTA